MFMPNSVLRRDGRAPSPLDLGMVVSLSTPARPPRRQTGSFTDLPNLPPRRPQVLAMRRLNVQTARDLDLFLTVTRSLDVLLAVMRRLHILVARRLELERQPLGVRGACHQHAGQGDRKCVRAFHLDFLLCRVVPGASTLCAS